LFVLRRGCCGYDGDNVWVRGLTEREKVAAKREKDVAKREIGVVKRENVVAK
jgi:hypothetical protein